MHSHKEIMSWLGVAVSQEKRTIISGRDSPRPRSERPPLLKFDQANVQDDFIPLPRHAQQISFLEWLSTSVSVLRVYTPLVIL